MNFGEAVEAMKQGKSVTNGRWLRQGRMLRAYLVPASNGHGAFIAWEDTDRTWDPMSYSHTNVLAEDWEILNN